MADDYLGTPLTTGRLVVGGETSGVIERVGDEDWFAVNLTAGTSYRFYGYDVLSRGGTLMGVGVSLYGPSGSILASAGEIDTIGYTPSVSGTYFLSAKSLYAVGTYSSNGMGSYKLRAVAATSDDYGATTQTAGVLPVGGEIRGVIESAGDRDWFAMDLVAGKNYRFAGYDSGSYGGSLQGVFVTLRSSAGTSISSSSLDGLINFTPSSSGRYFLDVTGYSGRTGTYLLQALEEVADDYAGTIRTTGMLAIGGRVQGVIGMPDDRDWFAVDLEAGKTYQFDGFDLRTGGGTLPDVGFRLHSDTGSLLAAGAAKLNVTPVTSGRYYVAAESATLNDRGSYTVTATEVAPDAHAAGTQTTGTLPIGGRTAGVIGVAGDLDWFAVDLVAGMTYRFAGLGSSDGGGTLLDVVLALKDPSGADVAGVNFTAGPGYTATAGGRYFLAASGVRSDTGTYTLTASAYKLPSLTLGSPTVNEAKGPLIYIATLSEAAPTPVTFLVKTGGGTATAGSDYVTVNRAVTIAAGATSANIEVSVRDDDRLEKDETVILTLTQVVGAVVNGSTSATGTILNDDIARAAFTVDAYRALNPDLLTMFGADDAAYVRHYISKGRADGRASAGYDSDAYAALNPDLLNIFGLNPLDLASHYQKFGRAEGRAADGFDAEAYAALNPDLFAVFGTDHRALINHYVTFGRAEGRVATGFDAEAYAALNPDLFKAFGLDASRLISHYISNGRAEGRVTEGFDAETYAALNSDLMSAFGLNHAALTNHYVNYGRAEGRSAFLADAGAAAPSILDLVGVVDIG